jgi:hypothetical protein
MNCNISQLLDSSETRKIPHMASKRDDVIGRVFDHYSIIPTEAYTINAADIANKTHPGCRPLVPQKFPTAPTV